MNANADDATNPDTDAPAAAVIAEEGAAEPTKSVRRKRAAKPAAPAADGSSSDASAEPAIADKPVRRRRASTKASDAGPSPSGSSAPVDSTGEGPIESGALASPVDTDAALARRGAPAILAEAASAASSLAHAEPVLEGAPSPVTPIAEAVAEVAAAVEGGGGEGGVPSERSRRRNRRDRRRGRGEGLVVVSESGAAAEGAEEDDTVEPQVIEPLPLTDPNEVFAHVVSGEFDAEEGDAQAVPAPAPKRVLRAEPDAPKLQKVLAQAGIGSRRDMEQLIIDGKVTVNGQPAHIGQRISFGDHIKVDGRPVKVRIVPPAPRVIAYHKLVGEVVTHDDPQHRPTVFRRLPRLAHGKWQSVGRLDINTEGLLLFTNSGELANQLMHPRFGVEREYAVRVLGTLDEEARAELLEGVSIDGQAASFKSIEDGGGEGANHWYRVVITEGRNREVRKLFDAVGLTVSRLIRIRYGSVVLPRGLKRGVWVDLGDEDVRTIRRLVGAGEGQSREERGGRRNKKRNHNEGPRNENRPGPRVNRPADQRAARPETSRERDDDFDDDIDPARIPNPLEQTFDKRFVQNPRSAVGGRGFRSGGGGFGTPGSGANRGAQKGGGGPKEPDPLQTSVGYIGADAFHRKGSRGGGGGKGGGFGGGGRRGR